MKLSLTKLPPQLRTPEAKRITLTTGFGIFIALLYVLLAPRWYQATLEYFGDYGNEVFRRVNTTSASEEVRFLEQRVAEMRREADESAKRLRDFEERYKVIDLESQSKAVVSAMASLRSQEISKELQ